MRYGTGVVLVVLAACLWSFMGLAIRQIGEAGTWAILFWRSVGMVPVLFAFIAWRSGGRPIARLRRVGLAGCVGGVGLVLAFAGAIYAIQATTIANAVFLFAASPFLAALLGSLLLREYVRSATWVAIAVAGVGMFVMVREGLAMGEMAGNVAALLSALGFAAFTLTLRWGKLEDMMPAVVLGGVFSMIAAALVLGVQGASLMVPLRDVLISMLMGAGLLGTGMVLYTLGSRVIPAAELTLLSMVEVMLAPVWVFLMLGETASSGTFLGGGILMAAVAGNALSGMRRKPYAPPIT
ncbi:EamA family transporter [Cereibacter changlensis JA139]|uniref:EamA family transporter n=2 Tax=Cereibacter changlensis TaxID=402884 RepID=A0A2T4JZF1_9RHOB|nr:DMT family transporter [Cereibacter changlensis]PTE23284.1 EamA family transporter [Cereibacter changlensis JA139]PZX55126.1 EamA domain-containing membrane protein RarD [Cereibacter changlensis]